MQQVKKICFLMCMVLVPNIISSELRVVQYWNGVANKNKKVTLAVRANSEIEECIWTHLDSDEEYSEGDKKKNDVEVKIDKFDKKDKKKTLCRLEIKKVKEDDHVGEWMVELEGKCKEKFTNKDRRNKPEFRTLEASERIGRKKRDANSTILISNIRPSIGGSSPIESLSGRSAAEVDFKRRKSERQRKSNCKAELEGIKLEFADDDKDLVLLPAMEGDALEEVFPDLDGEWGVNPNKKTILSTRINQFPDECIVLFDGEEIVQVEKKAKKDDEECEKFEKAKVCISKHEDKGDGIYACQLAIDDMNEDLEGNWEVEVKAGREAGSVEFDVAIDESGGDCEVEEGEPRLANVKGDELTVCTDELEEGDEFTLEVEFTSNPKPQKVEWEMRRKNKKQKKVKVEAGKKKSGFEAEDEEEDDDVENRYLAAITFELEEEDLDEDENFMLIVKNKEKESEFLITLDSSRRCKPTQEIGEGCDGSGSKGGDYECDVDDDKDCRCNKKGTVCCDASRRCEENCCKKCSKKDKKDNCDLCDKNKRKCMTSDENEDDDDDDDSGSNYECDPEDDKDCRCDDEGKGDNCCDASKRCKGKKCCKKCSRDEEKDDDVCNRCDSRGRKCMKFTSGGIDGVYGKAVKVMLESCVKLGGTLLEQWTPEGDERDDRKSDRDFKNDVEDFFETAKCTKFDDDIQDYFENGDKKKRKNRFRVEDRTISDSGSGTISFQNTALRNKVAKVASSPNQSSNDGSLKDILGFASDVVNLSKNNSG